MNPRHILITGASSGIGAALARHYAAPGRLLTLHGRNANRLDAVAGSCRAGGAETVSAPAEIRDAAAMADLIAGADDRQPLDLVIANAGMAGHDDATGVDVLSVNLMGLWNTVEPVIGRMRSRGTGQLGLMSSLAGFIGLPGAGPYCAAKAGARVLAQSLRIDLAQAGIGVSVICPGFVDTPLTRANRFPMPWLMADDDAAVLIAQGLARNRAVIAFPWPLVMAVRAMSMLPASWSGALLRRTRP